MNTKNIKAVIFDMDGTLIDTEKYYRMFWPKALAHFGYEMTDEQALTMRSLGQPYAPQHLKEMFRDPDLDYTAIRNYRKQIMGECLKKNGIEIKKGAIELLDYLKAQGIRRAIATATDQVRTEQYLKQLGLYGYFDQIICALVQMCETVNLLTCKGRSCCHQIFVLRHLSKIIGCFNRI